MNTTPKLMKAIVYTEYGTPDMLELKDVAQPTPKDDEVLVKVYAAALNFSDWGLLRGAFRFFGFGLFKPKHQILGADIAGRVEAVGKNVKDFRPGDEVYGDLSWSGRGGLAEYVCAPEHMLAHKPANLSFELAAAVPMAAGVALQALRNQGQIKPGQKVAISGASGGIGTFAVQIAKALGAHVTAIASTKNLEMASAIGADQVIDYSKEDFTANGHRYDLILAANGYHRLSDYRRVLTPNGKYVMTGGAGTQMMEAMLFGPFVSLTSSQKMGNLLYRPNKDDLMSLKELIEAGKVVPVISKIFPLNDAAEAFRYYGAGHVQGKILIRIQEG
jgi:NADPH:quinone reductase-like Zn-dependent oxidoreductase